jgi:hypothetical protein
MKEHLENVLDRFVIATLESPTRYLIFKDNNITFTNNISRCTKSVSRNTARTIREEFYAYTGMTDIELVILPIQISYEIIQEEEPMIEGVISEILS